MFLNHPTVSNEWFYFCWLFSLPMLLTLVILSVIVRLAVWVIPLMQELCKCAEAKQKEAWARLAAESVSSRVTALQGIDAIKQAKHIEKGHPNVLYNIICTHIFGGMNKTSNQPFWYCNFDPSPLRCARRILCS